MYNYIQAIMNGVFLGSAQPIQTQMTGFYLKIDHKKTGWTSYPGPRRSLFQNLADWADSRTDVFVSIDKVGKSKRNKNYIKILESKERQHVSALLL